MQREGVFPEVKKYKKHYGTGKGGILTSKCGGEDTLG
jgi:hypothetical protein